MSAMTPPPRARQALPLNPAKNRKIINVTILFENPQPRVKKTKRTLVRLKIVARPYISDIGAQSNGPAAKPYPLTRYAKVIRERKQIHRKFLAIRLLY